jgi:flavin-dependent dehydrogenase
MKNKEYDKKYDIIIVGAGPAGMGAAAALTGSRLKVAIIDNGVTVNPVLVTTKKVIEKFGLEKTVIQKYNKFSLYSKNYGFTKRFPKGWEFVLVDIKKAKKIVKKRVDFDVIDNTEIIDAKRDDSRVILTDFKNNQYKTKVVIDASGNAAVAAKSLGLNTQSRFYFSCFALELENCSIKDPHEFSWDVNPDYTNGAFNMYPYSKTKGQFVIADFEPYALATEEDLKRRLMLAVKKERPYSSYFNNAKIVKGSEFSAEFPLQVIPRVTDDNLIVVGASAGHITNSAGEGFRPGIELGSIAGILASQAVKEGDVSRRRLYEFENAWKKSFGKHDHLMRLTRFISAHYNAKETDIALKLLNKLNEKEFFRFIASDVDFGLFLKYTSFRLFLIFLKIMLLRRK